MRPRRPSLLAQWRADWRRHCAAQGGVYGRCPLFQRSFIAVANYRLGAWSEAIANRPARFAMRALYRLTNLATEILTGALIRPGAHIGPDFTVHTSFGLIIAGGATLGRGCTVNSGVAIVQRSDGRGHAMPVIGDDVWIGAGAKIMGGVRIGPHCVIGANAVVLDDIPAHHTAVGVPARAAPRSYLNASAESAGAENTASCGGKN